jgi:hypothetical protein
VSQSTQLPNRQNKISTEQKTRIIYNIIYQQLKSINELKGSSTTKERNENIQCTVTLLTIGDDGKEQEGGWQQHKYA